MNFNHLRQRLEADDDTEEVEKDPVWRNYLMATQSSYGQMLDDSIRSFVSKEEMLTDIDIRDIKDYRPRELMENPNSFALLFQENHKHDNKTPWGQAFDYRLGGQNSRFNRLQKEKELQYQEFRRRVELERGSKKVIKNMTVIIVTMIKTTEKYHILRLISMEALILYLRLPCQVSLT